MQKAVTLILTAIIVSLDSFVAGFSVSLNKKQNAALPATVALVTLALCVVTTYLGKALQGLLDDYVDFFGAVILFALAVANLLKKDDERVNMRPLSIVECAATGVAVGMDASVANLSLAVQGYGLVAPLFFAVTHYFTVLIGQKLAGKVAMPKTNVFSAIVLAALAITKII